MDINHWPSVVALVPARDEAETLTKTLDSLLTQDYPGSFHVVVIDDHSGGRDGGEGRDDRRRIQPKGAPDGHQGR